MSGRRWENISESARATRIVADGIIVIAFMLKALVVDIQFSHLKVEDSTFARPEVGLELQANRAEDVISKQWISRGNE